MRIDRNAETHFKYWELHHKGRSLLNKAKFVQAKAIRRSTEKTPRTSLGRWILDSRISKLEAQIIQLEAELDASALDYETIGRPL